MTEITYGVPANELLTLRARGQFRAEGGRRRRPVAVDLEMTRVTVCGSTFNDAGLRAAIEEAGYEAA